MARDTESKSLPASCCIKSQWPVAIIVGAALLDSPGRPGTKTHSFSPGNPRSSIHSRHNISII